MDGGREDEGDVWDYKLGSCQPNWAYCTMAGRLPYAAYMNFRECGYTNVESPYSGTFYEQDMIDITITDKMAQDIKNGNKLTLFDALFLPDQYQMIRVTVD